MKAVLMKVLVIDFDDVESDEGADFYIENGRYPNRCISPRVIDKESFELGGWDDDNPLNQSDITKEQIEQYLEEVKLKELSK